MEEYRPEGERKNLFPYVEYPKEIPSNEDFRKLTPKRADKDCRNFEKSGLGEAVLKFAHEMS